MTAFGTIIFSILVPGMWTVLIPYLLITSRFDFFPVQIGPIILLGLIPAILGTMTYVWCAWCFTSLGKGTPAPIAPPKNLVIKGPYRPCRKPAVHWDSAHTVRRGFVVQSAALLVYAGFAFLIFHTLIICYEEPTLSLRFSRSYNRYCASVPRWIPRWTRKMRMIYYRHPWRKAPLVSVIEAKKLFLLPFDFLVP